MSKFIWVLGLDSIFFLQCFFVVRDEKKIETLYNINKEASAQDKIQITYNLLSEK